MPQPSDNGCFQPMREPVDMAFTETSDLLYNDLKYKMLHFGNSHEEELITAMS